jgi:hypothetical protein
VENGGNDNTAPDGLGLRAGLGGFNGNPRFYKETERLLKESGEETDRRMKALQKSMGDLSNRFGELAGHLVVPNIVDKFNALVYHFKDVCRERKLFREDRAAGAEFDILLENGANLSWAWR